MPTVLRFSLGLKAVSPAILVAYAVARGNDLTAWLEAAAFVALMVASAGIHEVGHVLAVRACGLTVHRVTLTVFGGLTHYAGPRPTRSGTAAIAAAGPLASAFLATALLAAWVTAGETDTGVGSLLGAGVVMNVGIACINLLPVPGFDGGRMLGALFRRRPAARQARIEAGSSSD